MAWRLHVVGLATSKGNDANGCGFGRERRIPARAAAFFVFSPARGAADLVQRTPLTLITPFPLHQVSSSFRRRAAQDLVQGAPLTPIIPFPLHQISSSFRRRVAPDLVQEAPLTIIVPFPLHQVPPTFPYCGPPAGGAAHICICTQIICSILCTWLIFYCIPQILEYNIVYQNNQTARRDCKSSERRELLREFKKIY